jgi:hypothetical protein
MAKTQVLLGTSWGMHFENTLETWEPFENFYLGQILFLCTRHYVCHISDLGFNFLHPSLHITCQIQVTKGIFHLIIKGCVILSKGMLHKPSEQLT